METLTKKYRIYNIYSWLAVLTRTKEWKGKGKNKTEPSAFQPA